MGQLRSEEVEWRRSCVGRVSGEDVARGKRGDATLRAKEREAKIVHGRMRMISRSAGHLALTDGVMDCDAWTLDLWLVFCSLHF